MALKMSMKWATMELDLELLVLRGLNLRLSLSTYYNNNNNLTLRSRSSQTPNWCMRPPPPSDFTGKDYGGIHTLPPSGFEHMTS